MKKLTLITSTILALSFAMSSPANAKGNEHRHDKTSYEKKRDIKYKKIVRHEPRHAYVNHRHNRKPPVTVIEVDVFRPLVKLLLLPNANNH